MTWTKTPDDFPDRLLGLSSQAYRLHHAATTYCNRLTTDGLVTRPQLRLIPVPPQARKASVVRELVDAGLWREEANGWTLTDFILHQPTAWVVRARREYDALKQRKRLSTTVSTRALFDDRIAAALANVNAAKEDQRARIAEISPSESPGDSLGPVPTRPDPTRPEGRGRGQEDAWRKQYRLAIAQQYEDLEKTTDQGEVA